MERKIIQVEFDGEWHDAIFVTRVPAGIKVRFEEDSSTTVIGAQEIAARIRGSLEGDGELHQRSYMASLSSTGEMPPSFILSSSSSSSSSADSAFSSAAPLVAHLEALTTALETRLPSKAQTTLGIHLGDSLEDGDESGDAADDNGDDGDISQRCASSFFNVSTRILLFFLFPHVFYRYMRLT